MNRSKTYLRNRLKRIGQSDARLWQKKNWYASRDNAHELPVAKESDWPKFKGAK